MIQIDMDMPVSCFYCPINQRILTLGGKCMCFCGLIKHELNDTTKRHESCPPIEVKEGEQKQAQPEHKTGHWILDRSGAYCCDKCMEPCATYAMMKPRDKFCKMCGSRNEVME